MPTGALATLAAKSSAQNAYMVSCLLASHGFVYLEAPFIVQLLPAMLAAARGAVFNGIPPYDLWERSARFRRMGAMPGRTSSVRCSAADVIKKPLFAVIGGANFPATPAALKAAKVAVGQTPPIVAIATGAIDKALAELKATGE